MARNIELKARLANLRAAQAVAHQIATRSLGIQSQVDTYFNCTTGRLKLREIDNQEAQLVWYARSDEAGPKTSDYQLVPVADATTLKQALTAALGMRIVVDKRREIYLDHNVRIHLDEVKALGTFLEFEAALRPADKEETAHERLAFLSQQFGIKPGDLLARSYSDMLIERFTAAGDAK